jgi:hypothetical protein
MANRGECARIVILSGSRKEKKMKKTLLFVLLALLVPGLSWGQIKQANNAVTPLPKPTMTASLTVIKPSTAAGMQKWGCACNQVQWQFVNVFANLNIVLVDLTAGATYVIGHNISPWLNGTCAPTGTVMNKGNTGAGGSAICAIPYSLPYAGHQFKVTVETVDGKVKGDSGPFAIANPYKIIKPALNDVWVRGKTYQIDLTPASGNVCGSGQFNIFMKDMTPGSGGAIFSIVMASSQGHTWSYTVPFIDSKLVGNQFKVMITAQQTGEQFAESDLFTVQ